VGWTIRSSIFGVGKRVFSSPKCQTGSGAYPVYHSVGVGGSFPVSKVAMA
jgi:hypothetical protein